MQNKMLRVLGLRWLALLRLCVTMGALGFGFGLSGLSHAASVGDVPAVLRDWRGWVLGGRPLGLSPYNDATRVEPLWWEGCSVKAEAGQASFELKVRVFGDAWLRLPGGVSHWPDAVTVDGVKAVVVEHHGWPCVRLLFRPSQVAESGQPAQTGQLLEVRGNGGNLHQVDGVIRYGTMPQRLSVPGDVGVFELVVTGQRVDVPVWEGADQVWLRRSAVEKTVGTDSLSVQVARLLEDGQPVWLRTQVDLTVGGRSREEVLGTLLPEGWKLSRLESRLPVVVDPEGRLKVQARAGKWTVVADAFRVDDVKELRFAKDAKALVAREVIGMKAKPDFRVLEFEGGEPVDPSQVKYPDAWKGVSLFQWTTSAQIGLVQRMRGEGVAPGGGLTIQRSLWLDDDGKAFTFRDRLTGGVRGGWRLDAADGVELGAVSQGDSPLLVTRNPGTGAAGVELRDRALALDARGRVSVRANGAVSASGWRQDAERVSVEMSLPPGWRLFALFGADSVKGDWLSAWTLLDLFLLLLFGLSVGRMYGWASGLLALATMGLAYHEPSAPRFLWFLVLVPVALFRVVGSRAAVQVVSIFRWLAVITFAAMVVPFAYRQIQSAMYPQLEKVGEPAARSINSLAYATGASFEQDAAPSKKKDAQKLRGNLAQDAAAHIQTGPAVPEWNWRTITFGWSSPVSTKDQVRMVLVPAWMGRTLCIVRVGLILGVLGILLRRRGNRAESDGAMFEGGGSGLPASSLGAFILVLATFAFGATASAQTAFPSADLLKELETRESRPDPAFPHAADISRARLEIRGSRMVLDVEVHVAARCAVPMPGKVSSGTPLTVRVDGAAGICGRRDGYLWVVMEPGVHRVQVEAMLAERADWQWTYLLRPRRLEVDAPEWEVGGLKPGGQAEEQVFFSQKTKPAERSGEYERQELAPVLRVERTVELGLTWQVRTTVRRLSPQGVGAQALVPLVEGERVLTSGIAVKDGAVEVRMGAREEAVSWESALPVTESFGLSAGTGGWVESWKVEVSPVWNIAFDGLAPVYGEAGGVMVPQWNPWPGEKVVFTVKRPDSIPGPVVTINRLRYSLQPGARHREMKVEAEIRSTLGGDFVVKAPSGVGEMQVQVGGKAVPVRMEERPWASTPDTRVALPLQPGVQTVTFRWTVAETMGRWTTMDWLVFPVDLSNVTLEAGVPESRWVLWAWGPQRGPAVRFWSLAISSVLGALVLRRFGKGPLGVSAWALLLLGLTQAPLAGAGLAVLWFYAMDWRGRVADRPWFQSRVCAYPVQMLLVGLTIAFVTVLVMAVSEGLMGRPEMRILGNDSTSAMLKWFQARASAELPHGGYVSVSIWWYRLMMLLWALWLASSAIRWFVWAWRQFVTFVAEAKPEPVEKAEPVAVPPPIPPARQ